MLQSGSKLPRVGATRKKINYILKLKTLLAGSKIQHSKENIRKKLIKKTTRNSALMDGIGLCPPHASFATSFTADAVSQPVYLSSENISRTEIKFPIILIIKIGRTNICSQWSNVK
jgi:hypothetical protein